jgi:hypothetical protein
MRSAEMRKGRVMKQLLGVLVVVLPTVLCAQTNVERLWRTLDSLNLASVNDWKMSPDLGKGGRPAPSRL